MSMSSNLEFFDFAGSFLKDAVAQCCSQNDIGALRMYIEKSTHQNTLQEALYKSFSIAVLYGHIEIIKEIMAHSTLLKEEQKKLNKSFLKENFLMSMYSEKKEVSQLLLEYNPRLFENRKIKTQLKKIIFRQQDYKNYLFEYYSASQEKLKLDKNLPLKDTFYPGAMKKNKI